jgi:D-tyrosyl-tRNA(Tyr) deacylase
VLLGVARDDTAADVAYTAAKVRELRVFEGAEGKPMDQAVAAVGGAVLVVSQFTLYGDVRRGRRPSFDAAAAPADARELYEAFVRELRTAGLPISTGEFQAMMQVELVNDGPVTILVDSRRFSDPRPRFHAPHTAPRLRPGLPARRRARAAAAARDRGSETIGAGRVLLETGSGLRAGRGIPGVRAHRQLLRVPLIGVSVGISSIAELQFDGGLYNRLTITERDPAAPLASLVTATGDTTSSVEDLVVATKVRIVGETEGRPAFGLRLATKLPNASNESGIGLDTTDFLASLLVGQDRCDRCAP